MGVGIKGFGGSGGPGPKLQGLSALPPAAVAASGIFQSAVVVETFQYWRLRTIGPVGIASIYEIAMIDTTGTPDYSSNDLTFDSVDVSIPTATEGPFADSIFSGSFNAQDAFDNNLGTRWNGNNNFQIHYIGWNFGDGNAKDIKKILARQVSGTGTSSWVAEKSNDGSSWTFVKSITLTNEVDVEIDLTT